MEENGYKVGHSTIIHGIKQVKEKKKNDSIFDKVSNRILLTSLI
jgi:hypothetical protein